MDFGEVGFAALSLAMALNLPPLAVSIPIVIVASIIIMLISQKKGEKGDVTIALVASGALALGVIITAFTSGFGADSYNYMFGSILAMTTKDVILSIILTLLSLGVYIVFYNRLFFITFDEKFAKTSGINVTLYQFLISLLTAFIVVIGMRMMGTLLISSLIVFPAIKVRCYFSYMFFTRNAIVFLLRYAYRSSNCSCIHITYDNYQSFCKNSKNLT